MAATGRSSISSSSLLHSSHHPPCNLNLRLRFSPSNSVAVNRSHQKRKCLCSPTTHPGSFRCAYHRRLEKEKKEEEEEKKKTSVGLNLRKIALINSLARFGSVEAERFRRGLQMSLVKPSVFDFRRRSDQFQPRLSRFCKDVQD